ncbi:SAC3/GANP/Nin1/mts3/eIF-3 p25 family-domain-containing protein [Pelagophyceae sp. CCMP2097]|nr:SAC3/GANP/Nin1/mts3/eIF-3 p25 family-domain-containing protein [Pelagophyceae sp. CCMP2097]
MATPPGATAHWMAACVVEAQGSEAAAQQPQQQMAAAQAQYAAEMQQWQQQQYHYYNYYAQQQQAQAQQPQYTPQSQYGQQYAPQQSYAQPAQSQYVPPAQPQHTYADAARRAQFQASFVAATPAKPAATSGWHTGGGRNPNLAKVAAAANAALGFKSPDQSSSLQQMNSYASQLQASSGGYGQPQRISSYSSMPAPTGANDPGLPASLKAYAERAFATCSGDVERAAMQAKLHTIISSAMDANRINVIDWRTAPIPPLHSILPSPKEPGFSSRKRQGGASGFDSYFEPGGNQSGSRRNREPPRQESAAEVAQRSQRADRFQDKKRAKHESRKPEAEEMSFEPVKGTCTDLEKDYFRLTSAPDPTTVRPAAVLAAALAALKAKWRAGNVEYLWTCNQLKAIRQDLTVQCIKDRFAVDVYETHARVALEHRDMNEYNQCQTQLKELYESGAGARHQMEFVAYHIFYQLYLQDASEGSSEMLKILHEMPAEAWAHATVIHALDVREAMVAGNYSKFFRLRADTPNMGSYILDLLADKVRVDAAIKICRAYKPTVPLAPVARQLGFEDEELCREFLKKLAIQFVDEATLNTKDSKVDPAGLHAEKTSKLL